MYDFTANLDRKPAANATRFAVSLSASRKVLQGFIAHIKQEICIRREIAKAQALDDHILADIGVARSSWPFEADGFGKPALIRFAPSQRLGVDVNALRSIRNLASRGSDETIPISSRLSEFTNP